MIKGLKFVFVLKIFLFFGKTSLFSVFLGSGLAEFDIGDYYETRVHHCASGFLGGLFTGGHFAEDLHWQQRKVGQYCVAVYCTA